MSDGDAWVNGKTRKNEDSVELFVMMITRSHKPIVLTDTLIVVFIIFQMSISAIISIYPQNIPVRWAGQILVLTYLKPSEVSGPSSHKKIRSGPYKNPLQCKSTENEFLNINNRYIYQLSTDMYESHNTHCCVSFNIQNNAMRQVYYLNVIDMEMRFEEFK